MRKFIGKGPWGVVAGVSGVLCFYLTVAVIVVQFIFAQVNGQTGQAATIFDTGWQTAMFVFAIITAVIFLGSLALFILKKIQQKKEGGKTLEKVSE